ncbi:MAG: hypothetical protein J6Y02_11065 [Pseudobutyrivibrio sp.]|nr:hypothetical protein [Pseudobutyrivibrio sp.]
MNTTEYKEAKRELCSLIACDYNNRLLRWSEAGDDILIHSVFNNDIVCRTTIYTTRYGAHSSYYLYFHGEKYRNAAIGISDPNPLTVTEASGYKFDCAENVILFVREVLRRVNQEKIYFAEKRPITMNDLPTVRAVDVIFNDPATIIIWADGSKTVVKCRDGEEFDPEKGLAMAISKKVLGNKYDYYDVFKKYVGKYMKKRFKDVLKKTREIQPDAIVRDGIVYERADVQKAQNETLRDIALNTAKNLRAEGKSLAEIAKIMGYDDPAVVRSILPNEEDSNNEV